MRLKVPNLWQWQSWARPCSVPSVPAHTEAVLLETKISLLVAALAIDVVKCNVGNLDGSQLGVANSGVKKHIS